MERRQWLTARSKRVKTAFYMCGIAGIYHIETAKPVDPSRLRAMLHPMAHRGPDGSGTWTAPGVGFGHLRLSIIDIAGSPQPMASDDEIVTITYNGEIYNFRELRAELEDRGHRFRTSGDTEVILAAWRQWGVEVYGGILNNSWLDRDLGVAGVVIDADGREHLVRSPGAVARVPQLAVHLDRDVNDRGLVLDRQQHLLPVVGLGDTADRFEDRLADWCGTERGSIQSFEMSLFDVQPATRLGLDGELLASGRIDNQVSCWASIRALLDRADRGDGPTAIVALFDHEEVGSESTTGASGPWLEWILERLHPGGRHSLHDALARSACLSVDCAHGVHPNYPERHDPVNRPRLDRGPVLKINANQRYATSPETAALFGRSCDAAGVPWQTFVSRNNVPCGSTIGPLASTRLGIPTADVGVAQLSMHSAREMCGTSDPGLMRRAIGAFFVQR